MYLQLYVCMYVCKNDITYSTRGIQKKLSYNATRGLVQKYGTELL